MPGFKKFFGFLFFVALMLVKVSALHVYTHSDAEGDTVENCTICDVALENQTSDISLSDGIIKISAPEITFDSPVIVENQQFITENLNFLLFSRPPPTSLS